MNESNLLFLVFSEFFFFCVILYRYFQGVPEAVPETEQRGGCAC